MFDSHRQLLEEIQFSAWQVNAGGARRFPSVTVASVMCCDRPCPSPGPGLIVPQSKGRQGWQVETTFGFVPEAFLQC